MNNTDQLAALGLEPSDYETTSLEQLRAVAKQFVDALNSAPGLIEATLESVQCAGIGSPPKNHFILKIRQVNRVYEP